MESFVFIPFFCGMGKKYSSSTLAELRQHIRAMYKHFGNTALVQEVADQYGLNITAVRNAVEGKAAKPEILMSLVSEFEKLAKLKPGKIPLRKVRQLSIADLYHESLFPAKFADLAADITGAKPNAVAYFVKNQIEGKTAYASSEETIEALYKVAENNIEWELKCRAEAILKKIA